MKKISFLGHSLDDLREFLLRQEARPAINWTAYNMGLRLRISSPWPPSAKASGRYASVMKRVNFESFILPNLKMQFLFCIAFKRNHKKHL